VSSDVRDCLIRTQNSRSIGLFLQRITSDGKNSVTHKLIHFCFYLLQVTSIALFCCYRMLTIQRKPNILSFYLLYIHEQVTGNDYVIEVVSEYVYHCHFSYSYYILVLLILMCRGEKLLLLLFRTIE